MPDPFKYSEEWMAGYEAAVQGDLWFANPHKRLTMRHQAWHAGWFAHQMDDEEARVLDQERPSATARREAIDAEFARHRREVETTLRPSSDDDERDEAAL